MKDSSTRNNKASAEVVINASKVVGFDKEPEVYEFVLNEELNVVECGRVDMEGHEKVRVLKNFNLTLKDDLFELNHVRVNPNIDNDQILDNLTNALLSSGVDINNSPEEDFMSFCFKPLGELSDIVRFYVQFNSNLVFLSNSVKLQVV
tara:strand:+ start:3974 stop:4417 length:444 start_codon:yes stop_codon:yes gene_type:complete